MNIQNIELNKTLNLCPQAETEVLNTINEVIEDMVIDATSNSVKSVVKPNDWK